MRGTHTPARFFSVLKNFNKLFSAKPLGTKFWQMPEAPKSPPDSIIWISRSLSPVVLFKRLIIWRIFIGRHNHNDVTCSFWDDFQIWACGNLAAHTHTRTHQKFSYLAFAPCVFSFQLPLIENYTRDMFPSIFFVVATNESSKVLTWRDVSFTHNSILVHMWKLSNVAIIISENTKIQT